MFQILLLTKILLDLRYQITFTTMSAKNVILTAIHFKGVEQVKLEVQDLADNCLCSVSHVRSIIRKVEKGAIIVR